MQPTGTFFVQKYSEDHYEFKWTGKDITLLTTDLLREMYLDHLQVEDRFAIGPFRFVLLERQEHTVVALRLHEREG